MAELKGKVESNELAIKVNIVGSGPRGANGKDGKDGYTPIKGVDYFDGLNGRDGRDGVDGTDYIITEADYSAIAAEAARLVPQYDDTELRELVDTKADKTALDETNRSLDFLWKLNEGVTWDIEQREESGHAQLPKGGVYGNVDEVRGKTEQETTNGYNLSAIAYHKHWSSTNNPIVDGNFTDRLAFVELIPTTVGDTFTVSADRPPTQGFTLYYRRLDADKSLLATESVAVSSGSLSQSFTIQKACAYIAVFILSPAQDIETYTNVMLERGSTAHPYEKFSGGVPMPNPDFPSEIVSVDEIRIAKRGYDNQPFRDWVNGFINGSGNDYTPKYNASFPNAKASTQLISVKRGDTVNIKLVGGSIANDVRCRLISNDGQITTYMFQSASGREASEAVTFNNAAYIVPMTLNASVSDLYITVNKPISEEEEQRTIIPPRPLNAIGDYKDKLNVVTGEWEYNTAEYVVDTATNVRKSGSQPTSGNALKIYFTHPTAIPGNAVLFCKYLKLGNTYADWSSTSTDYPLIYADSTDFLLKLSLPSTTTAAEAKAWLIGKGLSILHPSELNTIPIDPTDLDYLRNLTLKKDDNLFITDNHGRDVSYLMSDFIKLKEALL